MSFTYANLPGVQVTTVDGGLAAVNTPTTKAIMVLGTSAIGPANSPYQIVSQALASSIFGLNGTLVRGMCEVSAYCDNIYLYRIGTAQGSFTVGATSSGSETAGTSTYAWWAPANSPLPATFNYQFTTPLPPDLVVGSVFTSTGFTASAFNVTSLPVLAVNQTTGVVSVAGPSSNPVTPESFNLAGLASIVSGTPNSLATVKCTQVAGQVINVGDSITIAAATSTTLNGTWTVLSAVLATGVWTVTFNVGASVSLAPTTQSAGTLVDNTVSPATVQGTGSVAVSANPGYTVQLGEVAATANTDYKVWYDGGILSLWLNNNLVYSNDPAYNVNTGDSLVTGAAVGGMAVNNGVGGNPDTLANAITLQAATGLVVVSPDIAPVYIAPVTGIGMSNRDLYIAQQNAMYLLQGFPIDQIVVPAALANAPNVAFYVSTNSATAVNNPVTNPQALDWLWTGVDVFGDPIYQYATETVFRTSNNTSVSTAILQGQSVATTPVANTFTTPTPRLAAGVGSSNLQPTGFHEISFAYQLARFCYNQSEAPQADVGGCLGFIGTGGPASLSNFALPAVKTWIGNLPTYDPVSGNPTVSGSGLLGIPFLVGCTDNTLNPACADFANGFRIPGLFLTSSGEYDGAAQIDANGYKEDIGAYITVHGDYGLLSNGFGTYVGNIANVVAGLVSSLDQLKAVTNKQIAGVAQLYRAGLNQLDALTFADINMLRFVTQGGLPVALHDKTAATSASDYTLTLRQRIKFLMIQTLLTEANNYIGNGTNDGLALTALKTALDADCLNLQKRGYISSYNFTITSTPIQQRTGKASIQVSFVPANELVQLLATVGINLNA